MRLIDADALEREGWSLCRNYQKDKNTMVYEAKSIAEIPTAQPDLQPTCNQLATDSISRQEAIRAYCEHQCGKGMIRGECGCDDCGTIFDDIPSVEPEQRWIPCSERQPEDGVRVLIMHGDCIEFGRYEDGEWMWLCESGTNYWEEAGKVDAWMPIPHPYQPERKTNGRENQD